MFKTFIISTLKSILVSVLKTTQRRATDVILTDLKRIREELAQNVIDCAEAKIVQSLKIHEAEKAAIELQRVADLKAAELIVKTEKAAQDKLDKIELAKSKILMKSDDKIVAVEKKVELYKEMTEKKAEKKVSLVKDTLASIEADELEAKTWLDIFPPKL